MATASVDGGQNEADVHELMGGPQMRREDLGSRIADGGDDGLLRHSGCRAWSWSDMNKMNARVTKVSDREVVHSSVGAVVIVLDGGRRVQESWLVVTRQLGKGKWEIMHDRAESLVPATEQGSPRFLGEHAAACRGRTGCSERGDSASGAKTGWRVRNPVPSANRG